MKNNVLNELLDKIEIEYSKLDNSIDRYNFRNDINNRLDDMQNRMIDTIRKYSNDEVLNQMHSVLEKFSGCKPEFIDIALEQDYDKNTCAYELGMDDLDWIEFIMEVETAFKVSLPNTFDNEQTNLSLIIKYIESHKK